MDQAIEGRAHLDNSDARARLTHSLKELIERWRALLAPMIVLGSLPLLWDRSDWWIVGLLLIAWPAVVAGVLGIQLLRSRAALAKQQVVYRVDSEGVRFQTSPSGASEFAAWSTLSNISETRSAFFIRSPSSNWAIVPKRAFAASEQSRLAALFAERARALPTRSALKADKSALRWAVAIALFLVIYEFLNDGSRSPRESPEAEAARTQ